MRSLYSFACYFYSTKQIELDNNLSLCGLIQLVTFVNVNLMACAAAEQKHWKFLNFPH